MEETNLRRRNEPVISKSQVIIEKIILAAVFIQLTFYTYLVWALSYLPPLTNSTKYTLDNIEDIMREVSQEIGGGVYNQTLYKP